MIKEKKLTIFEVAKLAKVSIATVSRVINYQQKNVSKKTKEKVLKVIQKYEYYPNAYAQYLGQRRRPKKEQNLEAFPENVEK